VADGQKHSEREKKSGGGSVGGPRHSFELGQLCAAKQRLLTHFMDAAEYENIAILEQDHWYYAGKRQFVREWICRVRPPAARDTLIDCGAGTGLFAQEMEALCRVIVLDDHEEALRILRTRFRSEQILSLAGDRVPLPDGSLEYVTALDVLEHVPDDAAVVRRISSVAQARRPGRRHGAREHGIVERLGRRAASFSPVQPTAVNGAVSCRRVGDGPR